MFVASITKYVDLVCTPLMSAFWKCYMQKVPRLLKATNTKVIHNMFIERLP